MKFLKALALGIAAGLAGLGIAILIYLVGGFFVLFGARGLASALFLVSGLVSGSFYCVGLFVTGFQFGLPDRGRGFIVGLAVAVLGLLAPAVAINLTRTNEAYTLTKTTIFTPRPPMPGGDRVAFITMQRYKGRSMDRCDNTCMRLLLSGAAKSVMYAEIKENSSISETKALSGWRLVDDASCKKSQDFKTLFYTYIYGRARNRNYDISAEQADFSSAAERFSKNCLVPIEEDHLEADTVFLFRPKQDLSYSANSPRVAIDKVIFQDDGGKWRVVGRHVKVEYRMALYPFWPLAWSGYARTKNVRTVESGRSDVFERFVDTRIDRVMAQALD